MATKQQRPRRAREIPSRTRADAAGKEGIPCVLVIAGLDPGGGAGLLADARAVARAGAFACAAATLLTIQSTSGMRAATAIARETLVSSCTEVVRHQRVRAIKVGALGSEENVRATGDLLAIHRDIPAIVDTVMMPTRGHVRLLEERAVRLLRERLLPRAALVTANAREAEVLTGLRVTRVDEARAAALELLRLGASAILVKGGHLGGPIATDVLAFARKPTPMVIELTAPRLRLARPIHGAGCTLASLVAGRLATLRGDYETDSVRALSKAVRWAKRIHRAELAKASDVGGDLDVLFA